MELTPPVTLQEVLMVDVHRLPTQAKMLAKLIGIEDAWRLISQYGGKEIKIPLGVRQDTYLHHALPSASADTLIQHWAGKRLSVPKNDSITRQIRDRRIFLTRMQGGEIAELVGLFNLSQPVWSS